MKKIEGISKYAEALMKMHLVTSGVSYDDLDKPVIGVVNSWNEIVPGHVPLRQVADDVKKGIWNAGGVPLEFNTIAICDGITQAHAGMRYPLPSRELIADSIEAMVKGHDIFEGLVFITACDKITPAMLMAAARLDIPAVFVTSGPMNTSATAQSKKEIRRRYLDGKIDEKELVLGSLDFYCGPGVCPFLGTANTMLMVAEALGMMLPGTALIPWGIAERTLASQKAGAKAVELAREDVRPSQIMTKAAFHNAVKLILATGGSLNTLLHLPAIAGEMGVDLTWEDFDRFGSQVPFICPVTPNGMYTAVSLHHAGGVPGVLKTIESAIDPTAMNVSGEALSEILRRTVVKDTEVIRPTSNPVHPEGGIAVLKGNLAPRGAVVKQSGVREDLMVFSGPAKVFDSEEHCINALEAGTVNEGSVLVIRYEGPQGGPGMREMHRATEIAAKYQRLALVTDGRFSGASVGLSIGYLTPEAYEGGPIAVIQDGDEICINIPERKLYLNVPEAEIEQRFKVWSPVEKPMSNFLKSYKNSIGPADRGARRE